MVCSGRKDKRSADLCLCLYVFIEFTIPDKTPVLPTEKFPGESLATGLDSEYREIYSYLTWNTLLTYSVYLCLTDSVRTLS